MFSTAHSHATTTTGLARRLRSSLQEGGVSLLAAFRKVDRKLATRAVHKALDAFDGAIQRPRRVAILGAGIQGCLVGK